MDQVILYNKSFDQRAIEYKDIFAYDDVLPARKIRNLWASYLELSVKPTGWQAVWNIPRLTCEELEISFPTAVLVHVQDVNYLRQEAFIKIIAVQDDIDVPEIHRVPLVQLWPMKQQNEADAESIANSLDALRFFYNHLWMPWDEEEETKTPIDFIDHLEYRLQLYYEMAKGEVPRTIGVQWKTLIAEARYLHKIKPETADSKKVLEAKARIKQIANEVILMENPFTRDVLIKRQKQQTPYTEKKDGKHWIVLGKNNCDEHLNFMKQVHLAFPNALFRNAASLDDILSCISGNDTIVLAQGMHKIKQASSLLDGCVLKAFDNDTNVSALTKDIMLEFGGNVTIENLTLDLRYAQRGLIVRKGKTIVRNCKIVGGKLGLQDQGFFVMPRSSLELINCSVNGFTNAIVVHAKGEITMKNCTVSDADIGLKIQDDCAVRIENTTFQNCEEYGISIETRKVDGNGKDRTGNFALLQMLVLYVYTGCFKKTTAAKRNVRKWHKNVKSKILFSILF